MLFEIIKPMTAILQVECNTKEEAEAWTDKILATLEDENGTTIASDKFVYFEAEAVVSQIKINTINY